MSSIHKLARVGWRFISDEQEDLHRTLVGLWLRDTCIFGLVYFENYPPSDPFWPDSNGSIGLNIFGRFVGIWNDPGE